MGLFDQTFWGSMVSFKSPHEYYVILRDHDFTSCHIIKLQISSCGFYMYSMHVQIIALLLKIAPEELEICKRELQSD